MAEEMNLYGKYLKAKKRAEKAEAYAKELEEKLDENRDEYIEQIRKAEAESAAKTEALHTYKSIVDKREAELANLKSAHVELDIQHENLKQELAQANKYVEEYCQENKELAEKLRIAEVEAHDAQAELARWTRPHDSEDLQLLADQAKDSNSLAAQAAYINGLKTELAQARERIKELENIERQYPLDDRACAYGCGPCRWEPGPWHQRGCPSWRKEAGE